MRVEDLDLRSNGDGQVSETLDRSAEQRWNDGYIDTRAFAANSTRPCLLQDKDLEATEIVKQQSTPRRCQSAKNDSRVFFVCSAASGNCVDLELF
jgi:hypothetical protein